MNNSQLPVVANRRTSAFTMRFDKTSGPSSPMRRKLSKKNSLKKPSSSRRARSPKTTRNGESKGSAQVEATSPAKHSATNGRGKKERNPSRARSRSKSLSRKVARSRSRRASRSRARKASRSRSRKASRSRSHSLRRHRTSERNFESREPPEPTSFLNRGRSEQRVNPRSTRDSQRKSGDTPWGLLARRSSSKTRAELSDAKTVRRPSTSNSGLFKKSIMETESSKRNKDWRGNVIPDSLQSRDADQWSDGKMPLGANVEEKEFLSSLIDLEPNDLGTKPASQILSLTQQPDSEDGGIELISMVTASGKPFTRIIVERAAGFQHSKDKDFDLPLDLEDKNKGPKLPSLKNSPIDKSASPKAKRFLRVFPWRQSAKTYGNQKLKHSKNTQVEGCSRRLQTTKPPIPNSTEAYSGTKSTEQSTIQDFSPPQANDDFHLRDKLNANGSCQVEDDTLSKPSELSGIEAGFELIAMWMKDEQNATQPNDSMSKNMGSKDARPPVTPEIPSTNSILTGGHQADSTRNSKNFTTSPLQGSTGSQEHESTPLPENCCEQGLEVDESDQRKENWASSARNAGDEQRDDASSAVKSTAPLSEEQKTRLLETPASSKTNPMGASVETSLRDNSTLGVGTTQKKENIKTRNVNPNKDIATNKEVVRDFQTIYMAPSRRRELLSEPFSKSLGNDRSQRRNHASNSAKHSVASSETSGTGNGGSVSVDSEEDGTTGGSTINTFDTDDEEETMRRKLSICTSTSSSRLSSVLGSQWEIISVLDNPSIYDEETGTVDSKALMKAIDSTEIYSLGSSSTAGDNYSASEGSLTRVNHALDTIKRYATRHGIPERDLLEAVAFTARSRAPRASS